MVPISDPRKGNTEETRIDAELPIWRAARRSCALPTSFQFATQPRFSLSQRDYASKPRVGHPRQRLSLPWVTIPFRNNPNGVAPRTPTNDATPSALKMFFGEYSQGSSCLTTLGFKTESRWDTNAADLKFVGNAQLLGGARGGLYGITQTNSSRPFQVFAPFCG